MEFLSPFFTFICWRKVILKYVLWYIFFISPEETIFSSLNQFENPKNK